MPTLVRDPKPVEFEALLERRRRLGQDLVDEVWEGVYHMNPAPNQRHAHISQQLAELLGAPAREAGLVPMMSIFNLGEPDDYRVPDGGVFRPGPNQVYARTAELVVAIVSPDDATWEKLAFYTRAASTNCSSSTHRNTKSTGSACKPSATTNRSSEAR